MAIRNWDHQIGAGPTILIIGFLFLMGYMSLSYIKYSGEQAGYHRCIDRQTHLTEQYMFNENLLIALEIGGSLSDESLDKMRSVLVEPKGLGVCVEASYF
jgi:hypothetical protein